MKIGQGKIRLEKRIIDYEGFESRLKTTDADLEKHYDSLLEHIGEISDYFENTGAFEKAVYDATKEKRPKLIAREPNVPFFYGFKPDSMFNRLFHPEKERYNDKELVGAHCLTKIQRKNKQDDLEIAVNDSKSKFREDLEKKFAQHPGYEGIIEVPNDENAAKTKGSTFHEGLHYIINRYLAESERDILALIKKEIPPNETRGARYIVEENIVIGLTEKLLEHDKDALFEDRWLRYTLFHEGRQFTYMASSLATAATIMPVIMWSPYLVPIMLVPGRIRDFALKKWKESKREELSKPGEYPKFKI